MEGGAQQLLVLPQRQRWSHLQQRRYLAQLGHRWSRFVRYWYGARPIGFLGPNLYSLKHPSPNVNHSLPAFRAVVPI